MRRQDLANSRTWTRTAPLSQKFHGCETREVSKNMMQAAFPQSIPAIEIAFWRDACGEPASAAIRSEFFQPRDASAVDPRL